MIFPETEVVILTQDDKAILPAIANDLCIDSHMNTSKWLPGTMSDHTTDALRFPPEIMRDKKNQIQFKLVFFLPSRGEGKQNYIFISAVTF